MHKQHKSDSRGCFKEIAYWQWIETCSIRTPLGPIMYQRGPRVLHLAGSICLQRAESPASYDCCPRAHDCHWPQCSAARCPPGRPSHYVTAKAMRIRLYRPTASLQNSRRLRGEGRQWLDWSYSQGLERSSIPFPIFNGSQN